MFLCNTYISKTGTLSGELLYLILNPGVKFETNVKLLYFKTDFYSTNLWILTKFMKKKQNVSFLDFFINVVYIRHYIILYIKNKINYNMFIYLLLQ